MCYKLVYIWLFKMEAEDLVKQLSENFTPDEAFMFGSQSMAEINQNQMGSHSKESLSFDGVYALLLYLTFFFHKLICWTVIYQCCSCCRISRVIQCLKTK